MRLPTMATTNIENTHSISGVDPQTTTKCQSGWACAIKKAATVREVIVATLKMETNQGGSEAGAAAKSDERGISSGRQKPSSVGMQSSSSSGLLFSPLCRG